MAGGPTTRSSKRKRTDPDSEESSAALVRYGKKGGTTKRKRSASDKDGGGGVDDKDTTGTTDPVAADEDETDCDDTADEAAGAAADDKGTTVTTDEEEDDTDDAAADRRKRKRRRGKTSRRPGRSLPGAVSKSKPERRTEPVGSLHEVPRVVAEKIRNYLDVLMSATVLEANRMRQLNQLKAVYAIPGVVAAILEYNNLLFGQIDLVLVKQGSAAAKHMYEPIQFTYSPNNDHDSNLTLYVCVPMYESYCNRVTTAPVIYPNGSIPLELFNLPVDSPESRPLTLSLVRCAVACDHVAQHILSEVLGERKADAADDIHYRWNEVGTTLHSIFRIVRTSRPPPKVSPPPVQYTSVTKVYRPVSNHTFDDVEPRTTGEYELTYNPPAQELRRQQLFHQHHQLLAQYQLDRLQQYQQARKNQRQQLALL